MSDKVANFSGVQSVAPAIAPANLSEILADADALLAMMGGEPLHLVAELADTLIRSAHDAGAWEIEAAASGVRRVALGNGPVALNGAMHALTEAITHTETLHAA